MKYYTKAIVKCKTRYWWQGPIMPVWVLIIISDDLKRCEYTIVGEDITKVNPYWLVSDATTRFLADHYAPKASLPMYGQKGGRLLYFRSQRRELLL